MRRPTPGFRAALCTLEGRMLLSAAPAQARPGVRFVGQAIPGTNEVSQAVSRQDGLISVRLQRYDPQTGTHFLATIDPSTTAVSVNVGSAAQPVRYTHAQSAAFVEVDILPGAPNPGEVDVELKLTPLDSPPGHDAPAYLRLKVMATPALLPPRVVDAKGTPGGIVLTFNRPLDPAAASDVGSYEVSSTTDRAYSAGGLIGGAVGWPFFASYAKQHKTLVPIKSARYDPAAMTVTLVPARKIHYGDYTAYGSPFNVSQGPHATPRRGIVAADGTPIDADTTPGVFGANVHT